MVQQLKDNVPFDQLNFNFSDDNDDYLPYVRQDGISGAPARSKPWMWSLAPYLGLKRQESNPWRTVEVNLKKNVFKCPSNDTISNYGSNAEAITGYAMPFWAGNGSQADSKFVPVSLKNVSSPSEALLLGEMNGYYFNGGQSGFTSSLYHNGRWNRLFVDGSLSQGLQNQGFSTALYWHRWSYNEGE